MADARLTIVGLYQNDNTIFDAFELPDGLEKDVAISEIMRVCSDFSLLYPDGDFMRYMIGQWSTKNQWTFQRWKRAIDVQYDPLSNYDRTESLTEITTGADASERNTNTAYQDNGATGGSETNTVSAYDSDTYSPASKTDSDATTTADGERSESEGYSRNSNGSLVREISTKGNIGVTTSQRLLQAELEIAVWNIYTNIAELFARDFCVQIY